MIILTNPLAPIAETYPYIQPLSLQKKIVEEIQRLLTLLEMKTGAYNFEARIDKDEKIYLMEVGPRNGGNGIPIISKYATGVDMLKYTIEGALGKDCSSLQQKDVKGFWSTYMVHSNKSGILKEIKISEEYRKENLIEFESNYKIGDFIPKFDGANGSIGTLSLIHI